MSMGHYGKLLHHFHSSDLCSPAGLIAFTITANLNEAAGWANEAAYITIQQGTDIPTFFQNRIEFFSYVYVLGKKSSTHTQRISVKKWIGRYFTPTLKFNLLKYSINTNMLGLKTKKVCIQWSVWPSICLQGLDPSNRFLQWALPLALPLNKNVPPTRSKLCTFSTVVQRRWQGCHLYHTASFSHLMSSNPFFQEIL